MTSEREWSAPSGAVLDHALYDALDDLDALRTFTEHHVWAVWDFMVLLCALHRALVHRGDPYWSPPEDAAALRVVNEIMVSEETDRITSHRGTIVTSHFQLYVDAMREMGADTRAIVRFQEARHRWSTDDPAVLAHMSGAPDASVRFMESTLALARGEPVVIAAAFTYGRERLIPDMFTRVLRSDDRTGLFALYLERHVEVDQEHGTLAQQLVTRLARATRDGDDLVRRASEHALDAREALWSATLDAIRSRPA